MLLAGSHRSDAGIGSTVSIADVRSQLCGKNLACFAFSAPLMPMVSQSALNCSDCEDCHSNVLLKWANGAAI